MDPHGTPYCPTCGRENPVRHSPEWLLSKFAGLYGKILVKLIDARRKHKPVSSREICFAAYVDSKNGPPMDAMNTVRVTISRERARLNAAGWDIVGPNVTGSGFYLVPLEQDDGNLLDR